MDRDPEVTCFVAGPWADPAPHRTFIQQRTVADYPRGLGYWTICPQDDPAMFLGWVIAEIDPANTRSQRVDRKARFETTWPGLEPRPARTALLAAA